MSAKTQLMAISLSAGFGVAVVASLSLRDCARSARFSDIFGSTILLQECQRRAKSTCREAARALSLSSYNCPMAETRSEEHTSELQSLMRTSYAVFYSKKK